MELARATLGLQILFQRSYLKNTFRSNASLARMGGVDYILSRAARLGFLVACPMKERRRRRSLRARMRSSVDGAGCAGRTQRVGGGLILSHGD